MLHSRVDDVIIAPIYSGYVSLLLRVSGFDNSFFIIFQFPIGYESDRIFSKTRSDIRANLSSLKNPERWIEPRSPPERKEWQIYEARSTTELAGPGH